jgi:hypothetical protein
VKGGKRKGGDAHSERAVEASQTPRRSPWYTGATRQSWGLWSMAGNEVSLLSLVRGKTLVGGAACYHFDKLPMSIIRMWRCIDWLHLLAMFNADPYCTTKPSQPFSWEATIHTSGNTEGEVRSCSNIAQP